MKQLETKKNGYFPHDEVKTTVTTDLFERMFFEDLEERRLKLYVPIYPITAISVNSPEILLVSDIVDHILRYNREDKDLPVEQRKPIKLLINSPGGDIFEGMSLMSTIMLSKTPVWAINMAMEASDALYIGMVCHRRFALPNTTFLLHDGEAGAVDSYSKFQDLAQYLNVVNGDVLKSLLLQYTNIDEDTYRVRHRDEWYMQPKEAIKWGICDEILTDLSLLL